MRAVSDLFLRTVPLSHTVRTNITCTLPGGGDALGLPFTAGTVTAQSGTGRRRSAELTLAPVEGMDLYEYVSTPGALFHIEHGFRYSGLSSELIPVFDGEASTEASPLTDGSVQVSLSDLWQRVERCRFISPVHPAAGTRAAAIGAFFDGALGAMPTSFLATGGTTSGTAVFDRDRGEAIKTLATDGGLEAYIEPDGDRGVVVVREVPTLDPELAVWTIRSGDGGTLIDGSRTRPLDRLYNTVVVVPAEDTQTWSRQVSAIENPNHPRYPGKIGVVPFFWSSPTVGSAAAAKRAADAILSRVVGTTETLEGTATANPALEPGDVTQVVKSGPVGQSYAAANIIDSYTLDLVLGSMTFATRATNGDLEEAA